MGKMLVLLKFLCKTFLFEKIVFRQDKKARDGVRRFKIEIKQPNKTSFFVDSKKTTASEVQRFVEKYNIQVSNPCTFLAQDKVKSFSEQGPKVLLHNTEKVSKGFLSEKF